MVDLASTCHTCGAPLDGPSDARHPQCAPCAASRPAARRRLAMRAHRNRLRAHRRGAPGRFSAADVRAMWRAQDRRCAYCARPLGPLYASPPGYHVEHRVPLERGGDNAPPNLCLSCPSCNAEKGTMTDDEFLCL